VPQLGDADLPEIPVGQLRQGFDIDRVLLEHGQVFGKAKLGEEGGDFFGVHGYFTRHSGPPRSMTTGFPDAVRGL
jgi:hypothetical protein